MRKIETLNERQLQIFEYLYFNNAPTSSEHLSKVIGISSKTIRKDIGELSKIISKFGSKIISKTGIGYSLVIEDRNLFSEFKKIITKEYKGSTNTLPFNYQRAHYIIRRLLSAKSYIKINDIADELFTSRTTIANDMYFVREILKEYNIQVVQRPNYGITYGGSEHDVRLCLVDEYDNYLKNELIVSEKVYEFLFECSKELYSAIENTIFEAQSKLYPLNIAYQNVKKIILMIILCKNRSDHDVLTSYSEDEAYQFQHRQTYIISKYIASECSKLLNHTFLKGDMVLLTIYLVSLRTFTSYENIVNKKRYYAIYDICEDLINYLCKLNEFTSLYSDLTLCENLALHFMSMLTRINYHVKVDHVHKMSIKQNSVSSIELAVQCAEYLKAKMNITMSENEICYLAFVFQPIWGRYNIKINKRNIIIISRINKSFAAAMAERFERNFKHYINKITLLEVYELQNTELSDYDFIFTDLPLNSIRNIDIPIVYIDTFFSEQDKIHIRYYLSLNDSRLTSISTYFKKEYFYTHIKARTKEEVFKFAYNSLKEHIDISSDFYDDLILRDEICSIEIGNNSALMKTLKSYNNESFVSVFILDKPIIWNIESVQVLVLWHRGINDKMSTEFFESGYLGNVIKSIFTNPDKTIKLIRNPYHDFMLALIKEKVEMSNGQKTIDISIQGSA